jgi:chromosome segregation ATPase
MKVVVILLAVGLLILGVLYFNESQNAKATHEQLVATSNQAVTTQLELASVKTQIIKRVAELESTMTTEKAKADEQIGRLQERVKVVEQDLQDEKSKLVAVEDDRTKVVQQLNTVSNQLLNVRQHYADLARTHTGTEIELSALREREETLEMEKASLERQLNDLDALKAQIRLVKRQLWEKRVAEWKRQDQEASAAGNKGMIFQRGQWQTTGKPSS